MKTKLNRVLDVLEFLNNRGTISENVKNIVKDTAPHNMFVDTATNGDIVLSSTIQSFLEVSKCEFNAKTKIEGEFELIISSNYETARITLLDGDKEISFKGIFNPTTKHFISEEVPSKLLELNWKEMIVTYEDNNEIINIDIAKQYAY